MMPRARRAFSVRREHRHGQQISGNTQAQSETCTYEELLAVYRHGVAMVLSVFSFRLTVYINLSWACLTLACTQIMSLLHFEKDLC